MDSLVSQELAEQLMAGVGIVGIIILILAVVGWPKVVFAGAWRRQGLLVGILLGLNWPAWKAYNWMVRFDPVTGYSGLDSVKAIAVLIMVFVSCGLALGWAVSKAGVTKSKTEEESRRT
jgi:hypothetical protein